MPARRRSQRPQKQPRPSAPAPPPEAAAATPPVAATGSGKPRGRIPTWAVRVGELVVAPVVVGVVLAYLAFFRVTPSPPSGPLDSAHAGAASSAPGTASPSAPIPLTVAAEGEISFACWPGWIVPTTSSTVPPLPVDIDARTKWIADTRAVVSAYGAVRLTVQGRSAAQVVLTSLDVEVVKRATPVAGTHVSQACGGPGAARELLVNLDHSPPAYTPINRTDFADPTVPWQSTPIAFPYKVSLTDAETFLIVVNTTRCDCSWRIRVGWASQGATGTYVVDDHGKPFRTTGTQNAVGDCQLTGDSFDCGPPKPIPDITP